MRGEIASFTPLLQVTTMLAGFCKTVGSAYPGSNPGPATTRNRRSDAVSEDPRSRFSERFPSRRYRQVAESFRWSEDHSISERVTNRVCAANRRRRFKPRERPRLPTAASTPPANTTSRLCTMTPPARIGVAGRDVRVWAAAQEPFNAAAGGAGHR
jgi:hypothetical protein